MKKQNMNCLELQGAEIVLQRHQGKTNLSQKEEKSLM